MKEERGVEYFRALNITSTTDLNEELRAEIASMVETINDAIKIERFDLVEEYIEMQTKYDDFLSPYELLKGMYNSYSPEYWQNAFDYYVDMAVQQGDLKEKLNGKEYYGQSESLFYELLGRKDLMEKIYAPFDEEKIKK